VAIKPCKECERAVSTTARRCPHCGAANPARGPLDDLRLIAPFDLIAALLALAAAYFSTAMPGRF
jgi:hypothetical protein